MNSVAIKTDGLTRDFGHVKALEEFSIEVPAGRVVALVGPNGAGKSTLLRLLMGFLEPTRGSAWVLGAGARCQPPSVSSRIASIGEGHVPPVWASARHLFRLQAGASAKFDCDAAEEFCRGRGVSLNKPYGTLSKGQRRWLLAGLAIASGADLLLLDEPADGLDPSARRELFDVLRDCVNDRQATAVVATHVISDIERVADDVAIIDHGRLALHASLEDLREQVREVEVPKGSEPADWGEATDLIATRQIGGTTVAWVRCRGNGLADLERRLGPQALFRTAGLEALYLAVTGDRRRALAGSCEEKDS